MKPGTLQGAVGRVPGVELASMLWLSDVRVLARLADEDRDLHERLRWNLKRDLINTDPSELLSRFEGAEV